MKIQTSTKVYTSNSKRDEQEIGRGVFAKESITKGETIEICPLIEVREQEFENLGSSIFLEYLFFDSTNAYLALGFGSLYNHSSIPNARYSIDEETKTIEIIATKDISPNTEITFNYKRNSDLPLWFE